MNTYNFVADTPVASYRKCDTGFILSLILLWGIGIFALYVGSINYAEKLLHKPLYFFNRQLISSVIGFVFLLIFCFIHLDVIQKAIFPMTVITVILCLLVFFPGIGDEHKGARRWIKIGFFNFQPSEAVKFVCILFLANYFDKIKKIPNNENHSVFPAVVGLVFFSLLIIIQRDFSTCLFLFLVGIVMFFASGIKLSWLVLLFLFGVPVIFLLVFIEPYRVNRLIAFLKPNEFLQGVNFQRHAALRAINAGGFWGKGVGSELVKINSIPEVQSDYIFAAWSESMGFVGVMVFFIILGIFTWRGYKIAFSCSNRFGAFASFGFITMIVLQSLLNCAVVCGLLPTTGIPLPFFSAGGSSMVILLSMCGFVINASRYNVENENNKEIFDGEKVYE